MEKGIFASNRAGSAGSAGRPFSISGVAWFDRLTMRAVAQRVRRDLLRRGPPALVRRVPEEKRTDLIPCGWFDRWADRIWATDPEGGTQNPPIERSPNGALLDDQVYRSARKPVYNPPGIVAPVLLVRGEWDR